MLAPESISSAVVFLKVQLPYVTPGVSFSMHTSPPSLPNHHINEGPVRVGREAEGGECRSHFPIAAG